MWVQGCFILLTIRKHIKNFAINWILNPTLYAQALRPLQKVDIMIFNFCTMNLVLIFLPFWPLFNLLIVNKHLLKLFFSIITIGHNYPWTSI
jgi:hypothetical protein